MNRKDALIALVPPLCWGTGFTIAKPAVEHFPPVFMMLLVYGGIAAALLATARSPLKTPWASLTLIASCALTIQGAMLFIALKDLDATTAALVLQVQVPAAILLGWLIAGEELQFHKVAGMALALLGVGLVIGLPDVKPPFWPVVLVGVSAVVWALGQVLARKLGRDDGILQLKGLALAGLPQLALTTVLLETGQLRAIATADRWDWLALVFVGAVGFYAAYAIWYALLRRCRVDEVTPFVLLMPVFSVMTAAAVLGERMSAAQLAGAAVIMAGLAVVAGLAPMAAKRAG